MKVYLSVLFILCVITSFGQFNGNSAPKVWLKADSYNPSDGYWMDVSGNSNHAFFSEASSPTLEMAVINFSKSLFFDGSNAFEFELDLSQTSEFTVITVMQNVDSSDVNNGVWYTTIKDSTNEMYLTTHKSRGLQGVARYSAGNMLMPVVNISGQFWGKKMPQANPSKFYLGKAPALNEQLNQFKGYISEFMVFDHLLDEDEIVNVQSYLGLKYGSTMMYSDYETSSGQSLWDFGNDKDYSFSIAGIGKDNGYGIDIKQAYCTSEEKFLVIGAGSIAPSNEENTYNLAQNNFLLWGSSDKQLQLEPDAEETYPNKLPILDRKWKMVTYGNQASDIPTELNVYANDLLGNPRRCYLVIDRTGLGDFSQSATEYIEADSISENGVAFFQDIKWDIDDSGSDLFSFSFGMDSGFEWEDPSCFNEASGKMSLRVRGGVPPYSYSLIGGSENINESWISDDRIQEVEALAYGNYSLRVDDGNGDYVINDFTMLNPEQMTFPLKDEYKLELAKYLELDATISGEYSTINYTWTGDNDYQAITAKVSINQAGKYTVNASNEKGCEVEKTLTVLPADLLYQYSIYPNPTDGLFFIELLFSQKSDVSIHISNSLGQIVKRFSDKGMDQYKFSHTLNDPGMYTIEIIARDSIEIFKLIVNK